jgi:hypothetical protein
MVNSFSITVFLIPGYIHFIPAVAGAVVSLFAASCIQIADQWEKAVSLITNTGLRGIIEKHELADLLRHRIRLPGIFKSLWMSTPTSGKFPVRLSVSKILSSLPPFPMP